MHCHKKPWYFIWISDTSLSLSLSLSPHQSPFCIIYSPTNERNVSGSSTENPQRNMDLFFNNTTKLHSLLPSSSRPILRLHHTLLPATPQLFVCMIDSSPSSGSVPIHMLSMLLRGIVFEP